MVPLGGMGGNIVTTARRFGSGVQTRPRGRRSSRRIETIPFSFVISGTLFQTYGVGPYVCERTLRAINTQAVQPHSQSSKMTIQNFIFSMA